MSPSEFLDWRVRNKFSQRQAAHVLWRKKATIQGWESGRAIIPYHVMNTMVWVDVFRECVGEELFYARVKMAHLLVRINEARALRGRGRPRKYHPRVAIAVAG